MNEDFIPFELAVKLREKGLPQDVFIGYDEFGTLCIGDEHPIVCASPIISQVLKWLREEKKIHIEVMFIRPLHNRAKYYITDIDGSRGDFMDVADASYETWEQATLAGIEYVLDNLI